MPLLQHHRKTFWVVVLFGLQLVSFSSYWSVDDQSDFEALKCSNHTQFYKNIGTLSKMKGVVLGMNGLNLMITTPIIYISLFPKVINIQFSQKSHAFFTFVTCVLAFMSGLSLVFLCETDALIDIIFYTLAKERTWCSDVPDFVHTNIRNIGTFLVFFHCCYIPLCILCKHTYKMAKKCPHLRHSRTFNIQRVHRSPFFAGDQVDFFDSSDEESVGRVDSPVRTRSMGNLESTLSNNNREYESVQSSPAVVTERETEMEDNQAEEIKITDESVSYSTQQNLEGAQKNKKLENENIQSPTVKSENETEMEDDQSELIKITDESVSYSTQGNLDGAENNKNLANDGQLPIAVTENETKTEDNQPEPIEIVDKSVSFSTQGNLDGAQKNNNLANDGQLPTAVTKYDTEGENKQSESTKMAEESGSSSTQEKMDGDTSDNKNLKNKSGQLPTIVIENADVEDNQPEPIKMVDKWTNI